MQFEVIKNHHRSPPLSKLRHLIEESQKVLAFDRAIDYVLSDDLTIHVDRGDDSYGFEAELLLLDCHRLFLPPIPDFCVHLTGCEHTFIGE